MGSMNFKRTSYTIIGILLILIGVLLALYPFAPSILYSLQGPANNYIAPNYNEEDLLGVDESLTAKQLPDITDKQATQTAEVLQQARVVIPKIGVDIELFEGANARTLEKGAWHLPNTANPAQIGNGIITAHRYKYRPPSSKTFYLLDKMAIGDTFTVYWNGGEYTYLIDKIERKQGSDLSILQDTFDRRVSLITCDPLFSTKNRLIVSGRLLRI